MFSRTLGGRLRSRQLSRSPLPGSYNCVLFGGGCGVIDVTKLASSPRFRSTKTNSRFAYPEDMPAYEDDWSKKPEYPRIDPETHTWTDQRRKQRQDILDWYEKIKKASCPEEKNLQINMPRQYGYKVLQIKETLFDYDTQAAYRNVTGTSIVSKDQLPSQYYSPEMNEKVDQFKEKVKEALKAVLSFEMETTREFENAFNESPDSIDLKRSQTLIPQINRVMLSILRKEMKNLKDCQVDIQPKVEAFWQMGGQEPSSLTRKRRQGTLDLPDNNKFKAKWIQVDDPVEEPLHYIGNTLLQVRCKHPPPNFLHPSDNLCKRSIEEFPYRFPHTLRSFGFKFADDYRFASIIPGHWSGDEYRCNLLAYHPRNYLKLPERVKNPYWGSPEENEEAVFSQAMLVSFGRLVSQAFYHGFDQFTDVKYPFSTQTVITNGLDWSFFAYQMNTMQFGKLHIDKNKKQNVMWGTQTQSIFDKDKQGELNDEVVGNLIRFYLNAPVPIPLKNPTPYLGQKIQDWDDKDEKTRMKRILTHWNFREQVCQRIYITDALLKFRPPEMYEWERIYKVIHYTMPLEARRRWFELPTGFPGYNPWILPYKLKDPVYESKGVRRLKAELAVKKEEAAMEAAKKAEKQKWGLYSEEDERTKK